MDFLLLLLGLVVTAIICAARGIVSGLKQPAARPVAPRPSVTTYSSGHHRPARTKRELRCISIRECETLIHTAEGVLFVTVTESDQRRPLPFYNTRSLVMTPQQLVGELRWFPLRSCVVLWGETATCSAVFELLEDTPKIPPIYVLRDKPGRWEVA